MYRILTEEKNIDQLKAMLIGLGLDFSVFSGHGTWQGQEENSLAIELSNIPRHRAEFVAKTIKSMNNQEAVRAGSAKSDRGLGGGSVLPQPKMAEKRRTDEQTTSQEPHGGIQGEGGLDRAQGREDTFRTGRAI
jgi:hypothetical protein